MSHPPLHLRSYRPHGVAYLLVLAVLTAATILSYGALTSMSLEAHVAANELAMAEARVGVNSGVDLARHYLLHPGDASGSLVLGDAGDVHFPGLSGFTVSPTGSFDVSVTNPDVATYDVAVTSRSSSSTGELVIRDATVRLVGLGDWAPLALAQFSGSVHFDSDVEIRGSIMTDGNFLGGGSVDGPISAANYGSNSGWSAPPDLPIRTLPDFDAINLVRAAKTDQYYLYNGQRCRMQRINSTTVSSDPTASLQNPGRVFYYDGNDPLKLDLSAGTFTGTLVVTRATVEVYEDLDFQPLATLPALLTDGRVYVAGARLRTYGVTYFNDGIWTASRSFLLILTLNGHELLPAGLYNGQLRAEDGQVRVEPAGATISIPDFTDQGIEYDAVEIEQWLDQH